jgi:hypothetical protein
VGNAEYAMILQGLGMGLCWEVLVSMWMVGLLRVLPYSGEGVSGSRVLDFSSYEVILGLRRVYALFAVRFHRRNETVKRLTM